MPKPPITSTVLIKVAEEQSGANKIERYEWIDATPAQLFAYANNDPNWRNAKPETTWASRLWRRLNDRPALDAA